MGVEIERKFLVEGDTWRSATSRSHRLDQGYFPGNSPTVRVRTVDDRGVLTIKGRTVGVTRAEFEYDIALADAEQMLEDFCGERRLTKTRHFVEVGDHEWVVDEFDGALSGLVLAEIELESEDESFETPQWVVAEVSGDARYFNSNLSRASGPPERPA